MEITTLVVLFSLRCVSVFAADDPVISIRLLKMDILMAETC